MSVAFIASLAPVDITVVGGDSGLLATESVGFSTDIIANLHHHSGNIFPTAVVVPGSNPKAQISVPFASAYAMFGLGLAKLSKCDIYLSKFVDYNKDPGSGHLKMSLAAGCFAAAEITGWSVNNDGIMMASVSITYLSSTGALLPVALGSASLPAISGSPALHTLGPVSINGTIIPGLEASSGTMNADPIVQRTDGDLYPRVCARVMASPSMSLNHKDPITVLNALGLLGANITSTVVVYCKSYDATTGVTEQADGISFTIAKGRVHPSGQDASMGQVASTSIEVFGITTDGGANPFIAATGVTVPSMT